MRRERGAGVRRASDEDEDEDVWKATHAVPTKPESGMKQYEPEPVSASWRSSDESSR